MLSPVLNLLQSHSDMHCYTESYAKCFMISIVMMNVVVLSVVKPSVVYAELCYAKCFYD